MSDENSTEQRFDFGDSDTQSVPANWVSGMLTYIYDSHPQVFAAALTHTIGIQAPARKRRAAAEPPHPNLAPITLPTGRHTQTG
jgi:hypothetical protein